MQTLNPQTLEERVEHLEQTLLAINCLSNIVTSANDGNGAAVPVGEVAFLLEYLSDDSLYRVEALRMQIHALPAAAVPAPRERRRKPRAAKLEAVA
jgi:hypothetical protein